MVDFSSLRERNKDRQARLMEKLDNTYSKKNPEEYKDTRFWYPNRKKDGNAEAIIRFLPAPAGEVDDFIEVIKYNFSGPGGTYNEYCLTPYGKKDPVAELFSKLWKQGERGQQEAKRLKRKFTYVCNIYVIKDVNFPENEGKVFLYRFGPELHKKIHSALKPVDGSDEVPIDAFCLFGPHRGADDEEIAEWVRENGSPGANFRMKVRTKGEFADYSESRFDYPSTLGNFSDEKIYGIHAQAHPLKEFKHPELKSFEELKAKMEEVLYDHPVGNSSTQSEMKSEKSVEDLIDDIPFITDEDDDIDLDYKKLMGE